MRRLKFKRTAIIRVGEKETMGGGREKGRK